MYIHSNKEIDKKVNVSKIVEMFQTAKSFTINCRVKKSSVNFAKKY